MSEYQIWAHLNPAGVRVLGNVFPDRKVPIQGLFVLSAYLDGSSKAERVFLVDWKELSIEQQEVLIEMFSARYGASKEIIKRHILSVGLPLLERHTDGCSVNYGFFL